MDTTSQIYRNQSATAEMMPPESGTSEINVSTPERVVSVAAGAGALLAAFGMKQAQTSARVASALAASMLLYRGLTGHCPINSAIGRNSAMDEEHLSAEVSSTVLIPNKTMQEVHNYWRKLENLPNFMHHLKEVKELDKTKSRWIADVPGKLGTVEWEAEIVSESDSHIAWRSLPGSTVDNAGEVRFRDVGGKGVEVQATISYRAPGGDLGGMVAKWINPDLKRMVKEDMRRFQQIMESSGMSTGMGTASIGHGGSPRI